MIQAARCDMGTFILSIQDSAGGGDTEDAFLPMYHLVQSGERFGARRTPVRGGAGPDSTGWRRRTKRRRFIPNRLLSDSWPLHARGRDSCGTRVPQPANASFARTPAPELLR